MRATLECVVTIALYCGVVLAQETPGEPRLFEVRQSYALPVASFLSLHIEAYGANVKLENGPAGLVEAAFHVADTLYPPLFDRYVWADSGDHGEFQFYRPGDWPAATKGELWEIRIPGDMDFVSILHAGFADIALWQVDELGTYFTADSANLTVDLSSLESGVVHLSAEALTGDMFLYAPRTAEVGAVALCTLGMLNAPGFTEFDTDSLSIPKAGFEFPEDYLGRKHIPPDRGGAEISLHAIAERGDVNLVLVDSE